MEHPSISIGSITTARLDQVWVAVSERGLVRVEFGVRRQDFERAVLRQLGQDPSTGQRSSTVEQAGCEIVDYLQGKRRVFEVPIDWSVLASDFQRTVLRRVMDIPYGETRTYGQIAMKIGHPKAPRAVGRANATNPMPLVIPCHRVIGSDGKLHGYGGYGGLRTKQWLLELEGAA